MKSMVIVHSYVNVYQRVVRAGETEAWQMEQSDPLDLHFGFIGCRSPKPIRLKSWIPNMSHVTCIT